MKNTIGIILIVASLALGYVGYDKVKNSGESIEVMDIELSATDQGQKTEGYIFLGLSVISIISGVKLLNKK